ncbi:MAG: methyl-accepting chemotaxis protein, partial [Terriglobales bacterium]
MKLTLGKKLGLGFAVVLALMIFSSAMTYMKSANIKQSQDTTFEVRIPQGEASRELQRDLNQTASKGRQVILAGTEAVRREEAKQAFDEAWSAVGKDVAKLDELAPRFSLQANRDRLAEVKQQLPQLRTAEEGAMTRANSSDRDSVTKAGDQYSDEAIPINNAIKKSLGGMSESFDQLLVKNKEEAHAENSSLNLTMAITTFVALGIGIFVAIFLSRSISGATQAVLAQAEAIAAGDLTHDDMKVRSKDELGDLTTAINKMSGSLKSMILAITQNSIQVASASEELSSTSQQITANSEETSAQAKVVSNATQQVSQNLQTVATGAEEMSSTIK